ncbi:hypothetical protein CEE37_09300 [candidate division LCP-89 bacterium B3_LCP]|uniref:Impact N-terminal domain-containing protein n=1 Tax=candidate division LCP-89 bacterium B3_LCP TaxID=2012998 RepID=A0A532UY92_UNCL8|nr:MAG: hypothetical protein CEE37_09300 [candidate division LCP-89 bacterium B3_LCP]
MPTPDKYLTIARQGHASTRVKGSRFIGFVHAVSTKDEADLRRAELKKERHDATHQPFAFRLANGLERSSDDGEPRGTSGISILKEIQAADLYDVQVVIVRYFGGTKLGKGGLARAFSQCAHLTLEQAGVQTKQNCSNLDLILAVEQVNTAKTIAAKFGAEVASISYDLKARISLSIGMSHYQSCREALLNRFGSSIFSDYS